MTWDISANGKFDPDRLADRGKAVGDIIIAPKLRVRKGANTLNSHSKNSIRDELMMESFVISSFGAALITETASEIAGSIFAIATI